MDATTLKTKLLLHGPDAPLAKLAALSVDALLDTPLSALSKQGEAVSATRRLLEAWLASDEAGKTLGKVVDLAVARLQARRSALKEVTPAEVQRTVRELVGRPFSPEKRLVLTIIDRPPMRELVRQLLLDVVLDFGRRASAPVAGVAKGLGALARMAGETVKAKSGGLGSLVGAVSGEVERQVEKRAIDFVDAALAGVFGQLADAVSDPKRAEEAAELRMAFFDGVLELTLPQLAREVMNADVPGGAEVLRAGLKSWLASEASHQGLQQVAQAVLERDGARTVRMLLADWGLAEEARALAVEQLAARLRAIVQTDGFSQWLAALMSP
ncbi:MAG: hypothetical protein IT380_25180 [Myxococcales bacterium]|nr:hypothetical protein [Myxococcales bacterium]